MASDALKYYLCPNEVGCLFSRTIQPQYNGEMDLYEKIKGKFVSGDVCSFKIAIPQSADLNDVMSLRVEYTENLVGYLIKGPSYRDPIIQYTIKPGQTYTTTKGVNMYLIFVANHSYSGKYVFNLWYTGVQGEGDPQPTSPDEKYLIEEEEEEDPKDNNKVVDPDPEPEP